MIIRQEDNSSNNLVTIHNLKHGKHASGSTQLMHQSLMTPTKAAHTQANSITHAPVSTRILKEGVYDEDR